MDQTGRDDLDERYESLPWERVGAVESPDRRWLLVAAGAVVVVAVVASAARTLWPAPPLSAPEPSPPAEAPTTSVTIPQPEPTVEVPLVTEADLRAISPGDAERAVTAHAEWFVSEWLTIDAAQSPVAQELLPDGVEIPVVDESARSFVESAVALSAEEVELGSWEVAVLVRSLSAFGDGEYLRIPARVFLVTVVIGDDGPYVADLPAPGPVPSARASALDLVAEPAPDAVIDAAVDAMQQAGLAEEATLTTERWSDLWRVTGVVRDPAGVPVVVAVWLDGSGQRVPAPG